MSKSYKAHLKQAERPIGLEFDNEGDALTEEDVGKSVVCQGLHSHEGKAVIRSVSPAERDDDDKWRQIIMCDQIAGWSGEYQLQVL